MFSFRPTSRLAVFFTVALVAWTTVGGLVSAAEEGGPSAGEAASSMKGPVWAVAYIVVLLLVGLGVFCTVRSSKRRDRAKPEEFKAVVKH